MATFEQVMQALRNADAAGNKEDARRLAQIAQSMRSQAAQPAQTDGGLDSAGNVIDFVPPPPVELQGKPNARQNVFGDVTGEMIRGPLDATKAFATGLVDQSQSPTMRVLPENWNPALKSIYARGGDAGMAALSAIGTMIAGGAGLVGEAIGGGTDQERRLASDLMMMGEVFVPELAGVSSVSRSIAPAVRIGNRVESAPTKGEVLSRAAGDLGITPSLGMRGKTAAAISAMLEKSPMAGQNIARDAERAVGEVEGAFHRIVNGVGMPMSASDAGVALKKGLESFVSKFSARSKRLYDAIPIDPNARFSADNVTAAVADLKSAFGDNPELARKLGLTGWDGVIEEISKNGISWSAMKQFRTEIGQAVGKNTGALTDQSAARLKALYGAITEDMAAAAAQTGPEALKAWQRANGYYRSGARRIERSLDATITATSPERAFEAFVALSKENRSTSDVQRMRQIKASLSRDDWNDVSASIVNRLGAARPGAQNAAGDAFSPAAFLAEWNKMAPEAKHILLPEDSRIELEKLATVAERVRASNAERNFSNTGTIVVGVSLANAPVSTISALAAAKVSAWSLTRPEFLRALNNAARGDTKALRAMSAGRGAFAKDAQDILRIMAIEATGGANENAPANAIPQERQAR